MGTGQNEFLLLIFDRRTLGCFHLLGFPREKWEHRLRSESRRLRFRKKGELEGEGVSGKGGGQDSQVETSLSNRSTDFSS